MLTKMKNIFSSSLSICCPVATVFEVLSQPDRFPNFIPAIKEAHWEDDSPLQTGKAYIETRKVFGKSVSAKVHVSQLESPTRIAYKSKADGITGEYVYSLVDVCGTTNIKLEAFAGASGLAKLILPLFTRAMKKSDANQLKALKEFLEI